jgi:hypothetical protein
MAQFLRPDSDITITNFTPSTGTTYWNLLDEVVRDDADYVWSTNNTSATLEVGLSNPSGTPPAGTCTFSFTWVQTNAGTPDGAGNNPTFTIALYQGATLITSVGNPSLTFSGTWQEASSNFSTSSITNFNDLRVRYTVSASGGGLANRRGMGFSQVYLAVPDTVRYTVIS